MLVFVALFKKLALPLNFLLLLQFHALKVLKLFLFAGLKVTEIYALFGK